MQPHIKQYISLSHGIWINRHSVVHSLLLELSCWSGFCPFLTQKGFADSTDEEWCRKATPKTKVLSHKHYQFQKADFPGQPRRYKRNKTDGTINTRLFSQHTVTSLWVLYTALHHMCGINGKNVVFQEKKNQTLSHKALHRQQSSGCLLFLHSKKETTKEAVK